MLLRRLLWIAVASVPASVAFAQGTPPMPPTPPSPPLPAPAPAPVVPQTPEWPMPMTAPMPTPFIDFGRLDDLKMSINPLLFDKTQFDALDAVGDWKIDGEVLAADRAAALDERVNEIAARATTIASAAPFARLGTDFPQGGPRAPWAQGDPADSIYRSAREAINRGDYRPAAKLFNECTTKFPKSRYVDDCGYWEAWARYRLGTMDDLRAAQVAIDAVYARAADHAASSGNAPVSGQGQNSFLVALQKGARFSDGSSSIDVPALRTRIYSALAMRGDAHAADELRKSAAQAGKPLCDKEDMSVQAEAMSALSQMDPEGSFPTIRRVLDRKDECSVDLRRNAVSIIARRNDTAAVSVLIQVAKKDTSKSVQETAISYLGRMPGDAAFNALEDLLKTSTDDEIQSAVVGALGSNDSPRARQSLRALLDRNPPDKMQIRLIRAMSSGDKASQPADNDSYLKSLYAKAKSDQIKEAIIDGLANGGGDDTQTFLLGVAGNSAESSALRAYALSRLGRTSISIAQLAKLYDGADSRSMREQLISVFGSRKEPEATDKLLDIVKTGTDPEMRKSAINALTRKNDPRATKLLLDLIKTSGGRP